MGRTARFALAGTKLYFLGTTAEIRDLRAVTASDQGLIQKLVPLAVLGVLIVILAGRLSRWS